VESLLELNYPKENLELILVNNASTDRTVEILSEFSRKFEVLYEKKRGPASSRNKGILAATNEIIAFTDSDCVVDKDWLQHMVCPLEDDHTGIVGGKILSKRPCNGVEEFGEQIHNHNDAINTFRPPYVISMNWASRLSVLEEVGLFDENFIRCEDIDLSYRVFQSGYKFVYRPEAIVYHRNEHTVLGLLKEGYLHGFWAIKAIKAHKEFVAQFGHRRLNLSGYISILSSFIDIIVNRNRTYSLCYVMFNSGKKIGKLMGSIRFRYLEL